MKKKKLQNYVISMDQQLGQGSFGKVYKGVDQTTKKQVAVKALAKKLINEDSEIYEAYISEIKIMRKLHSQNIVQFMDVIETQNNYYIIQQFCNGGDLRSKLQRQKKFSQEQSLQFIIQILNGFLQLIANGIIHRDVKPQNILINNKNLKIADFGFAKTALTKSQLHKTLVGTPLYMSPQMLKQQKYTSKCDIWAIGLIFYQFLYGKVPWTAKSEFELVQNITKIPLKFPKEPPVKDNIKTFIEGCLKIEEKQRFSWYQVYKHPLWMGKFNEVIEKNQLLERKIKYVINELRIVIHSSNLDLEKLFGSMNLNSNSSLKKQQFFNLIRSIDKDISQQEFQFLFTKLDNGNSMVQIEKFKKCLADSGIRLKSLKLKKRQSVQPKPKQYTMNLKQSKQTKEERTAAILVKLLEKIQFHKLNLKSVYDSYAKNKENELNFEMFSKLLSKIDNSLPQSDIKNCYEKFDPKATGKICYEDFNKILGNVKK